MATDEIIELERRGWDALSTEGRAAEFYADVLDDDPMMLLPGGLVLSDRQATIDAMAGQPWSSYDLSDERVVNLGDDAGVVAYAVVARRDGAPEYSALVSSTYVRRDGRWRLAFHQQTPR